MIGYLFVFIAGVGLGGWGGYALGAKAKKFYEDELAKAQSVIIDRLKK